MLPWMKMVKALKAARRVRLARSLLQSPADGAAALTARATVWLAILTFLLAALSFGTLFVLVRQLGEMQGSGVQTDRLIELYRMQHAQMSRLATETHDLAESAKHQADASKTIAANAGVQSRATRDIAKGTQGQLATMQDQLEISHRAWLEIVDGGFIKGVSFEEGKLHFRYKVTFKNSGNVPAINIGITSQTIFLPFASGFFTKPVEKQKEVCEASRQRANSMKDSVILFPDFEPLPYDEQVIVEPKGSDIIDLGSKVPKLLEPVIVGCVDYQFRTSKTHHQTGFIFQVMKKTANPELPTQLRLNEALGPEQTVLYPYFFGGRLAN